ncbi:MAG: glycoside hydrolase family 3 N-terminal domain-containing protein, partial [Exilibacterium sp.]
QDDPLVALLDLGDVALDDQRLVFGLGVSSGFGAVVSGGGSFPGGDKNASVSDWTQLAAAYRRASMDNSPGYTPIPLLWATDAVHGHNNAMGATLFPHNIGLGATNNPELLEQIGLATAAEVAATGINWVLAPSVAVARDDRWGRTYESYSEDPQRVQAYAGRIVTGLQKQHNVIATAKHFIADGGTYQGQDGGDTRASETR